MATRKTARETGGLTPKDFERRLDSRDFGNFYVLQGEDQVRAEQFLELLRSRLVAPGTEDFSLETITVDKERGGAGEIIGAAETIPFMGGFRLVIVRHGEELDSAALEALAEYAEKVAAEPRPDMLLILRTSALDRRLKFAKTMQKLDAVIDCEPEPVRDLSQYMLDNFGKRLSPEAQRTFQEVVGEDRRRVTAEMEKLALYAADKETVEAEDVMAICAASNLQDEWELKNCLQAGDVAGALAALKNLRSDPAASEEGIFAKICYIMSELPVAASAVRKGDMRGARIFPGNPHYQAIRSRLSELDEETLGRFYEILMYQMIAFRGSALPKDVLDDLICLVQK